MVNINKIKALAKEKGVLITFLCQAIGQGEQCAKCEHHT